MFKKLWFRVTVVVLTLGLVAGGVVLLLNRGDEESAVQPEPTVWEKIQDSVGPDGRMGTKEALQAFAFAFGPLPGVQLPPGRPDPADLRISGSGAIRAVRGHWDELTVEQRQAVTDVLESADGPQRWRQPADEAKDRARLRVEEEIRKRTMEIGNRLGTSNFVFPVVHLTDRQHTDGTVEAWTVPVDSTGKLNSDKQGASQTGGRFAKCHVVVPPSLWRISTTGVPPPQQTALTHELMHCYQAANYPTILAYNKAPMWIIDGGADFGAYDIVGGPRRDRSNWEVYLRQSQGSLFEMTYPALGWWFHIQTVRGKPWPWSAFITIWSGAQDGIAAYKTAGGDQQVVYDSWASSFLRRPAFGARWEVHGVAVPTLQPPLARLNAGAKTLGVRAFDAKVAMVETDGGTDTVVRVSAEQPINVHDAVGFEAVHTNAGEYCIGKKCTCPDGTDPGFQRVRAPLFLAVPGGEQGNKAVADQVPLEQFCKDKKKKPPIPGPECAPRFKMQPGAGCPVKKKAARSNGDPHLTSFDGRDFDFQAGGEFTMAKGDGMEIQARTEPYVRENKPDLDLSVNTAAAANVAGDRVAFYAADGKPQVKIDGTTTEVTGEHKLPKGGVITPVEDGYRVGWPDGTSMHALSLGSYGINILIEPAESRRDKITGLLGPFQGIENNPAMVERSGRRHDKVTSPDQLYKTIGDSWRISQPDSLFDYDAGKSTETYTRRDMPGKVIEAKDLTADQRKKGEEACFGIEDPHLHEQCVFDFALTDDKAFAESYQDIQKVLVASSRLLRDGDVVKGKLNGPDEKHTYQIDGKDVLVVDITGDVAVEPEAGNHVKPVITDGWRFTGPESKITVSKADGGGDYSFKVVTLKPKRFDVNQGDRIKGRLDEPGRVNVYSLDIGSATTINLADSKGCDYWVGLIEDKPDAIVWTPYPMWAGNPDGSCRTTPLVVDSGQNKRYQLVVWSKEARTLDYEFTIRPS